MTEKRFTYGAAIPGNWTVAGAIGAARAAPEPVVRTDFSDRNLAAGLMSGGGWPVRDQGPRGTCNAFAVVAAEELVLHLQDPQGPTVALSEEHLYAKMRAIGVERLSHAPASYDLEELSQTGGT